MRLTFNHTPPGALALGFQPDVADMFPEDDWKYADVHHVHSRTNDLVRAIIDRAPLKGGFRRTLIDVKVQDLTPDIWSCVPGWHIDGQVPNGEDQPDVHHLCVLNGPQTEFVAEPVQINLGTMPDFFKMADLAAKVPANVKVAAAREGFITTFTSYDFHRGVKAAAPTRRLLVRLTETNTVLARNQPHKPAMGARG